MILIGEKLNSSVPSTQSLIAERDEAGLIRLIRSQEECGAQYLDINTAISGDRELEDMLWLIDLALKNSECGIMIDSVKPQVVGAALGCVGSRPAIVNSVTAAARLQELGALIAEKGAGVVCLPIGGRAVSHEPEEMLGLARDAIGQLQAFGVKESKIYIDVLVQALAVQEDAGTVCLDFIRAVKRELPEVRTVCGLSNISFGLPGRININTAFLSCALYAGLDAAILDVISVRMRDALFATEALLGRDEYCIEYIGHMRDKRG